MVRDGSEFEAAIGLIEARVVAEVADRSVPGVSVAIVRGLETVWAKGFGFADLERRVPAGADTVYACASITKLFTATMLMQLRDAGLVALDDPVQQYLPDVSVPRRHAGAPEITFRHLVTHTSGLAKEAPAEYWASLNFPAAERLFELLPHAEQPFPPGVRWKYSNLAFALLGQTLACVAGMPWEDYIAEKILRPLGMTRSVPRLAWGSPPGLATGYDRPVAGWPPNVLPLPDLGILIPGGGLYSTASDMARFLAEHMSAAPTILARASIIEMRRANWLLPDWSQAWGMPWFMSRADGATRFDHGGSVFGFTSKVLLSPADGLGVVVFTNGSDSTVPRHLAAAALDVLVPTERRSAVQRQSATAQAIEPEWEHYVGRYRWVFGDAEVVLRDSGLVLRLLDGPGEEVALRPDGEREFQMSTGPLCGERARFDLGDDGRVRSLWVGPHPYDRV